MYVFTDSTLKHLLEKIKSKIALKSELDNKVDKVDGKSLSDNDFTDAAKYSLENNYASVEASYSTGMTHIKFSNKNQSNTKTIDLKTGCDMFFYPTIDAELIVDSEGNVTIPYAFISRSGSDIGKVTVNIENLTENTNSENVFNVTDNGSELVLEGASLGNTKLSFTIEGDTEELKANVLGEYSTVIMSLLTIYRSTDASLVPSNVSNAKTVVNDFGNGEYEIMLGTLTRTNYLNFSDVQTLTNVSYMSDDITNMYNTYYNCTNLTGKPVCGNKVTNMAYTYYNCSNLTGSPVCEDNVTDMSLTYSYCINLTGSPVCGNKVIGMPGTYHNCTNLTGSPVCGDKVIDMYSTYYECSNLTGNPVCGPNVTNMYNTYYNCTNLTGKPVCGPNVQDMALAYSGCTNLTGSPVCKDNVTNMYGAYMFCNNLTGSPVCGNNVTTMLGTYYGCTNLTGSPVCGPNVQDMSATYAACTNLTGSPVCEDNVTDMSLTYSYCNNLTGSPVCGRSVTSMDSTYYYCYELTGSPVCGPNVQDMPSTYYYCHSLTGSPVCGAYVTNMSSTYYYCNKLTGSPVCGRSVTNMSNTYYNCSNLTGFPVCGDNVTNMHQTYYNCPNLSSNAYFYSNKITNIRNCFHGRNTSKRLNLSVPVNSTTLNTCLSTSSSSSLTGTSISWTNDTANNRYYSATQNIYIYPVANVARAYKKNEFGVVTYTASAETYPIIDGVLSETASYSLPTEPDSSKMISSTYTTYYRVSDDVPDNIFELYQKDLIWISMYDNESETDKLLPLSIYKDTIDGHTITDTYIYYPFMVIIATQDSVIYGVLEELTVPKGIYVAYESMFELPITGLTLMDYSSNTNYETEVTIENDIYNIELYMEEDLSNLQFGSDPYLLTVEKINFNTVTNMQSTFMNCANFTGPILCGDTVECLSNTYYNCQNLTGAPVCGNNVTNMYVTYYNCINLTGSPVCGPNVKDMYGTYYDCYNLTGSPACGDNVINMSWTYQNCFNLTGQPVCGPNVTIMYGTYSNCINLTGSPVCGDNVTNMSWAYQNCFNLTGKPVCGNNVSTMYCTYYGCTNLKGNPVCGDKVTDMAFIYYGCTNLTGQAVCGPNVTSMSCAYSNCYNLIGSPVCGDKVIDMYNTYCYCRNLTGSPVCGDSVTNMAYAYAQCHNLTGNPVCGPNVTNMVGTYVNCINLSSNGYFYSNKVANVCNCFAGKNKNKMLNLYVPVNNTTLNTCLSTSSSSSLTGTSITWTNDTAKNRHYSTAQNIYIYPVANVKQAYKDNELLVTRYTMSSGANVIPKVDSTTMITTEDITNDDGTITRSVYLDESQAGKIPRSISFNGETDLLTVEKLNSMSAITDTSYMFNGCSNLTRVCAMDWDTSKIVKADYMFAGCSKLTKESFVKEIKSTMRLQSNNPNVPAHLQLDSIDDFIMVEYYDYFATPVYTLSDLTKNGDSYEIYFGGAAGTFSINSTGRITVVASDQSGASVTVTVHYNKARRFELPNVESASHIFDGCTNLF